jgi:hypothetical protein
MRSSLTNLFACAVLALIFQGAGPGIYKWVDDEGNVHYGDSPPDNVEAELVNIESRPTGETGPSSSRLLEDAEKRYRRLEQEREARAAARDAEEQVRRDLDERCVYLRKQLISLQQQLPVYRDEDGKFRTVSQYDAYEGNREYLDDATRAREIERVTAEMLIVCKKPGDRGEQFVAGWHRRMEQRCDYARLKLKELHADKRATRQAIRDAQSEVDRYCDSDD